MVRVGFGYFLCIAFFYPEDNYEIVTIDSFYLLSSISMQRKCATKTQQQQKLNTTTLTRTTADNNHASYPPPTYGTNTPAPPDHLQAHQAHAYYHTCTLDLFPL